MPSAAAEYNTGIQYPRGYWQKFALPAVIWLLVFFILPMYTVVSVAFGTVDPIFRGPVPVYQPWWWSTSAFQQVLRRFFGDAAFWQPTLFRTFAYVAHREHQLPVDRLHGRVLRRTLRRQRKDPLPGAADLAVLDQLPDADLRVAEPAADGRVRERHPARVPPDRDTGRLALGETDHRGHVPRLRLRPVHDPARCTDSSTGSTRACSRPAATWAPARRRRSSASRFHCRASRSWRD